MVYRSILVGADGSDTALDAVRTAAELAVTLGASLTIVTAYQPPTPREYQEAPAEIVARMSGTAGAEDVLRHAAKVAKDAGCAATTAYRNGSPADVIVSIAEEEGIDLIVVGNKGMTGAKRFLLGSVPNAVSHHAPCAVLIVKTT